MENRKLITKNIELALNYRPEDEESEGYKQNKVFRGGVKKPEYMQELSIDVYEDEIFDQKLDDFIETGKMHITLSGSDRALEELGKYLIALSRYITKDPSYHDHFDNVRNSNQEEAVNMIIRKQPRSKIDELTEDKLSL